MSSARDAAYRAATDEQFKQAIDDLVVPTVEKLAGPIVRGLRRIFDLVENVEPMVVCIESAEHRDFGAERRAKVSAYVEAIAQTVELVAHAAGGDARGVHALLAIGRGQDARGDRARVG